MEHEWDWGQGWTESIGRGLSALREVRGLSAAQLAQRCSELGYPISRSQITKLEIGDRKSVTVQEVAVLASALAVPPLYLLFPLSVHETQHLPGESTHPYYAMLWWMGENVEGYEGGPERWMELLRELWLADGMPNFSPESRADRVLRILNLRSQLRSMGVDVPDTADDEVREIEGLPDRERKAAVDRLRRAANA